MFLNEQYQIQDTIGQGPIATVYRAWDIRMKRNVALKVLHEVYNSDPDIIASFQYEARAATAVRHPNIVEVYEHGLLNEHYLLSMELIEGPSLRKYLASRGMLAPDRTVIIAHDVALGLGAAHRRGIVHKNIKPQNILIGRDGSIKLTGFGIGHPYQGHMTEHRTMTDNLAASVPYVMPELTQREEVLPATDVYALGMAMYEMLTGRTAFTGKTSEEIEEQHMQNAPLPPSQLNPAIPPAMEEIILRCLEKTPEKRFSNGSQLAHALEALNLM
ncbi:MAG TPA: serine/threonine-protein kinase [Ktedonobacteraceae bacterium]|jgi:serine/threonine-protein kinase|nr:serine/threonine-protein kinase [Ktedonobacteraceae bacterium]